MSISENIKRLRESHGMTQAQFGDIAGVTDKAVSTWESGKKEPRMGAIQKLCDHFGISKSDILLDDDDRARLSVQYNVDFDHYLTIALTAVGERIQSRRKALGISAEDLASFLHIPPASVYRYENGDAEQFPIDYLVPTAGFLRTTTSYLLSLTDDPDSVIASPFPGSNLTAAEIELVHRYRRAPQEIRTIVDTALSPYGEQAANPASSEQSVG